MELPSSGGDALPMAKVPCEFRADRPTFIFQGRLRQAGEQPPSPRDGGSSAAGGSGRDLAHLLRAALLQGGCRYGPAVFRG